MLSSDLEGPIRVVVESVPNSDGWSVADWIVNSATLTIMIQEANKVN